MQRVSETTKLLNFKPRLQSCRNKLCYTNYFSFLFERLEKSPTGKYCNTVTIKALKTGLLGLEGSVSPVLYVRTR